MNLGSNAFPDRLLMCTPYFGSLQDNGNFRPDVFLDVSAEVVLKNQLISAHSSQDVQYWIDMADRLGQLYGMKAGVSYAEAYQTANFYRAPRAKAWI